MPVRPSGRRPCRPADDDGVWPALVQQRAGAQPIDLALDLSPGQQLRLKLCLGRRMDMIVEWSAGDNSEVFYASSGCCEEELC